MFKDLEKLKRNAARRSPKQLQILDWFDFKEIWSAASSHCTPDSGLRVPAALVLLWAFSSSSRILWCTIVVKKSFHIIFLGLFERPLDQIFFKNLLIKSSSAPMFASICTILWLNFDYLKLCDKIIKIFRWGIERGWGWGGSASCGCSEQIHFFKVIF